MSASNANSTVNSVRVVVRDQGQGFDPDSIPEGRRGVRESIVGRMERLGGKATIHSQPGRGTEVDLMVGCPR